MTRDVAGEAQHQRGTQAAPCITGAAHGMGTGQSPTPMSLPSATLGVPEPGLGVPALRGELVPVPMAAPRELTCGAVTSAGADGAARSKNILFPCECH